MRNLARLMDEGRFEEDEEAGVEHYRLATGRVVTLTQMDRPRTTAEWASICSGFTHFEMEELGDLLLAVARGRKEEVDLMRQIIRGQDA